MQNIADLPNLGQKSKIMLENAGFRTVEQIKAIGSAASYIAVKRTNRKASLNLLWALEGAISGRHWLEVAKHDRIELLIQRKLTESQNPKAFACLA